MAEQAALNKKLVQQRGLQKSIVTKFQTYVTNIEKLPDDQLDESIFCELKARLEKLDAAYDEFFRLHILITDTAEVQNTEHDTFEKAFFQASGRAQVILGKIMRKKNITPPVSTSRASDPPIGHQTHLPKVEISKFSGEYDSWVEFRDTYSLLIDTNASLSNIQKYHYLRSALVGDAALVIKGLAVSADTYDEAWQTLRERYDNPRSLVKTHIQILLDLPAINKESSQQLNRFRDNIGKH